LLKINKEYLNHDYYTDVITFDYCRSNIISGDIFISLERVNANAKDFKSADSELFRVIIHGVLHLIGFVDHSRSSDKLMRKEEDAALNILFGLS
jgi:rRNA maturation RNase YbeY